ncbi:hypothetical protein AAG570_009491 [Ranatra chinensis]|uniref:Uncharacterized protein n=1 Tax=Ranatra chinensis TaxID=642074 RepID=A0ABD0YP84_9HEMI
MPLSGRSGRGRGRRGLCRQRPRGRLFQAAQEAQDDADRQSELQHRSRQDQVSETAQEEIRPSTATPNGRQRRHPEPQACQQGTDQPTAAEDSQAVGQRGQLSTSAPVQSAAPEQATLRLRTVRDVQLRQVLDRGQRLLHLAGHRQLLHGHRRRRHRKVAQYLAAGRSFSDDLQDVRRTQRRSRTR